MLIIHTVAEAIGLMLAGILLLGTWPAVWHQVEQSGRLPAHTFLDYSLTYLAFAAASALTLGQLGSAAVSPGGQSLQFLDQLSQPNWQMVLFALAGGTCLALGDLGMQYSIALCGLSVGPPILNSITLIVGVILAYFLDGGINKPQLVFTGAAFAAVAVAVGAAAHVVTHAAASHDSVCSSKEPSDVSELQQQLQQQQLQQARLPDDSAHGCSAGAKQPPPPSPWQRMQQLSTSASCDLHIISSPGNFDVPEGPCVVQQQQQQQQPGGSSRHRDGCGISSGCVDGGSSFNGADAVMDVSASSSGSTTYCTVGGGCEALELTKHHAATAARQQQRQQEPLQASQQDRHCLNQRQQQQEEVGVLPRPAQRSITAVPSSSMYLGLAITVVGGLVYGCFMPAFQIAANDPFKLLASPTPPLSVYTTYFYFAVAFTTVSVVANAWLMYRPPLGIQPSCLSNYLRDNRGRVLSILSGVLAAAGDLTQFIGGQTAGYAAAMMVMAYPVVGVLWGLLRFRELRVKGRVPWGLVLVVAQVVLYILSVGLLSGSAELRSH